MKASELAALREKNPEELNNELIASLKEVFNLRMQGREQKSHLKRIAKRKIATIKTIITEKG